MLINEDQGFVVWEEGSLRPVVLIFILAIRVSNKRTILTWSWEMAQIRPWRNFWKRLNKAMEGGSGEKVACVTHCIQVYKD